MAAPGISISIIGDFAGVEAMLLAVDTALNPVAIAGFLGAEVDPWLRTRARSRFASEGDDAVGQWAPLKESTQDIRSQLGYGASHPINVRTGELENYITGGPNRLDVAPWGASLTFPNGNTPGDLKEKVEIAQIGGGDRNTVPRPVLGLSNTDLTFVLGALAGHIQSAGAAMGMGIV